MLIKQENELNAEIILLYISSNQNTLEKDICIGNQSARTRVYTQRSKERQLPVYIFLSFILYNKTTICLVVQEFLRKYADVVCTHEFFACTCRLPVTNSKFFVFYYIFPVQCNEFAKRAVQYNFFFLMVSKWKVRNFLNINKS